ERGERRAAVDEAADDAVPHAGRARVLVDGRHERAAGGVRGAVDGVALVGAPAVALAVLDDVDLLVEALADVAAPERAGGAVKGDPPRVAQAPGVDLLLLGARRARERVRRRDAVGRALVDVEAEDLPEVARGVERVVLRVAARPAVALRRV